MPRLSSFALADVCQTFGSVKLARASISQTLNELEIPHLYHSVARNSPKRKELTKKWDTDFQVPYLEDPNTGTALFETDDINKYLERTYAL